MNSEQVMCALCARIRFAARPVVAPYGCERTSNEGFVGHADPGVPRKNLRIRRDWPPGQSV